MRSGPLINWTAVAFNTIRAFVWVYDVLSLPVFFLVDWPIAHWRLLTPESTGRVTERKWLSMFDLISNPYAKYQTMAQLLRSLGSKHGQRPCLGHRKVLEIAPVGV